MACNCRKFPFAPDPPCFDECLGRLLNTASESVLRQLNVPHVDKLVQFRKQQWIDNVAELHHTHQAFTPTEVDDIRGAVRQLAPHHLQLFLP